MQLSKRLNKVAEFVPKGSKVADIGCDHAHTSIYLVMEKRAASSIAMDINEGPLKRAKENIQLYGCEDKIETRLSDGAKKLQIGEADTIIISGMGGLLINKILSESKEVIKSSVCLILQPQSELREVRKYVHELGFKIVMEDMLTEDEKHYTIIKAYKGQETYDKEVEYRYGKILLEQRNPSLKAFLLYGIESFSKIINSLEQQNNNKNKKRLKELKRDLVYMEEAFEYYKQ